MSCPEGKERNPKTGRCVKKCSEGQERSPVSGNCVKKCPAGTTRNSTTGRCNKVRSKSPKRKSPTPKSPPRNIDLEMMDAIYGDLITKIKKDQPTFAEAKMIIEKVHDLMRLSLTNKGAHAKFTNLFKLPDLDGLKKTLSQLYKLESQLLPFSGNYNHVKIAAIKKYISDYTSLSEPFKKLEDIYANKKKASMKAGCNEFRKHVIELRHTLITPHHHLCLLIDAIKTTYKFLQAMVKKQIAGPPFEFQRDISNIDYHTIFSYKYEKRILTQTFKSSIFGGDQEYFKKIENIPVHTRINTQTQTAKETVNAIAINECALFVMNPELLCQPFKYTIIKHDRRVLSITYPSEV